MSNNFAPRSFAGLADCYLGPYGGATNPAPLGNVSKCDIEPQVKKFTEQNYGRSGGTRNTFDRLTGVNVSMILRNVSVANLATALRAGVTSVASGTVASGSAESHDANLDCLIRLAFINPSTVVVKDSTGTTTYVAGTDYKVTGAGVIPLSTGAIAEGDTVKINYGYSAQKVVEAFTEQAGEYYLVVDGLNEAEGTPQNVVIDLWRFKPGLVKTLSVISDDYVTLQVDGDALADDTKTAAGTSQFFRWVDGAAT